MKEINMMSPGTEARHHNTKNNGRCGILSLLLSIIMLVKPSLASAQATQPQGPVKEPQKVEAPQTTEPSPMELFRAILGNDAKKVEELISQGADCNVIFGRFLSLNIALQRGCIDAAVVLIRNGALIDGKDGKGGTPLSYIIGSKPEEWSKYTEVTRLLLDKGIDVNAGDDQGVTPLHRAAAAGRKDIASLFFAHGGDIAVKDNKGRTLLQYAIASGSKDTVSFFLAHGADIDGKDDAGRTLLHYAAGASVPHAESHNNPDIVQLLLGKGINVDEVDSQLKKLLSAGSDVNVQDEYGIAPLHLAASAGYSNAVELLIAQGARLDIKDNAGRTPFHYAAEVAYAVSNPQKWSVDMVRLLVDAGADINIKDDIGWTPLHYAAIRYKKYLIEVLMEKGADVDIVDNRGRTPSVAMQEKVMHLETIRGSEFESASSRDYRKTRREVSELLHKNGCMYVVATHGEDTNPGTNESPLRTIAAAIEVVNPGDVILVRGGTYVFSRTIHIDKSGEQGSPIHLVAYPGEVPVFDFAEAKGDSVFISGAYWHIKGLALTRAMRPILIHGSGAHHNILEQVSAFGNQHAGIFITTDGPACNVILNCDSYSNFDPQSNGENADGFGVCWNVGPGNVLIGNRSWNNSDDGFDMWEAGNAVRLERCYAFGNGVNIWDHPFFYGNANGFKLGRGQGRHILINCIAWGHSASGFDLNNNSEGVTLRNCTGWDNLNNYYFMYGGNFEGNILRNNLSYGGRDSLKESVDSQFNSWDADLVLTGDDFLSLDDSVMSGPRNPDGSIPQNNFLKLAPTSGAIDKGVDIGMPFVGEKPDLGAFEYDPNKSSQGYVKMLHQYVRDRDIKRIKELLAQGEGINDKDWLGYTPLQWAVYFGYPDVVELLLSQGADQDIQSDTGRFALEIAKAMVYADIEALLNKHKEH